jgi:hypothetical protein
MTRNRQIRRREASHFPLSGVKVGRLLAASLRETLA